MKLQYQEGNQSLKVLETGAGAGGLAEELCRLAGVSLGRLHVTDISDGMLAKATERLRGLAENGGMVTVEKADFTDLPYENDAFDRYYANMCLHYADDPDVVLRECSRVLKRGGIAGFSVWGRSKDSPLFTIVPDVLDDFGLVKKDPSKRSSFHLGEDDNGLRQRFFEHRFSQVAVIHFPTALECFDPESYVELIIDGSASTKQQVESFSEEDQKRVREEVAKRSKTFLDRGVPMALDTVVVVARK